MSETNRPFDTDKLKDLRSMLENSGDRPEAEQGQPEEEGREGNATLGQALVNMQGRMIQGGIDPREVVFAIVHYIESDGDLDVVLPSDHSKLVDTLLIQLVEYAFKALEEG